MKTRRTMVGRLRDEQIKVMDMIKKLEAIKPRTPEIKTMIFELVLQYGQLHHARANVWLHQFEAKRLSQAQRQKRGKRHTWKGQTREQLSERNQEIIEHFKKTRFTPSNFADIHAAKYGIKPRTVRLILSKAVGS